MSSVGAYKTFSQAPIHIKHAGGHVQQIHRPISAQEVMLHNPKHWVTKEGVFRSQNPVSEVVLPETVLLQGQTFLLVPFKTMQKLMKRRHMCPSSLQHIMDRPGLAIRGWYYEQHGDVPVVCCKKNCNCSCTKEKMGCKCSTAITDCKCSCAKGKTAYVYMGDIPVIRQLHKEIFGNASTQHHKGKKEGSTMLCRASGAHPKASDHEISVQKDARSHHTPMSKETLHNKRPGPKVLPCSSGSCVHKSHEPHRMVSHNGLSQRMDVGRKGKDKGSSTKQNRKAQTRKVHPSSFRQQAQSAQSVVDNVTKTSNGKGHSMIKSCLGACTFWSASFWKKP